MVQWQPEAKLAAHEISKNDPGKWAQKYFTLCASSWRAMMGWCWWWSKLPSQLHWIEELVYLFRCMSLQSSFLKALVHHGLAC